MEEKNLHSSNLQKLTASGKNISKMESREAGSSKILSIGGKASYNIVKVPKAPLMACLTCTLCNNLFFEATTICECLHTFCEDCIRQRLSEDEENCCPMCNVLLGCLPLEKLRVDNQLRDLTEKIFPRKRSISSTSPISAPFKRKERSLLSLGVQAISSPSNPDSATQKGKPTMRKGYSTNALEEVEDRSRIGYGVTRKTGDADEYSLQRASLAVPFDATASDSTSFAQLTKGDGKLSSLGKAPKELQRSDPAVRIPMDEQGSLSSFGRYFGLHSKLSAISLSHNHTGNKEDRSILSENILSASLGAKLKSGLVHEETDMPRVALDLPSLPYLANVAESDAGRSKTLSDAEPHILAANIDFSLATREGSEDVHEANNEAAESPIRSPMFGQSLSLRATKNLRRVSSQLNTPYSNNSLSKEMINRPLATNNQGLQARSPNFVSALSHEKSNEVWFTLRAAENQAADGALPQISAPYIRIRDGRLPVSLVKKYLARKLDLRSETEVEITCRGQPVVSSLPLESVQNIWLATASAAFLFPEEEIGTREPYNATCTTIDTACAKDVLMVLTYGRNRRSIVSH
ncbi:hypothetical protein O6H91_23G053700 [Diphasiastrum complanatum]|uniref:Uncharacterized protein n=5 Tax=Diphasiastrum complanatum TaxID=34168 RepID=A0ACC2AAY0_DIPCM|nr:hypothetical protein O6H91_23G053700 [Diphasiastrum complanatum]KAJ7514643.1 hypothetical protein O6H91_23G053700 [Diphasiastrum complanatum]KAJ7514644.1 hypothetical protein O6H91_23G053700 [Diphasiastrum complanatum]KAJ7514650.1 hypothetical protein O6H91_23G053700 [Diphasiastrum complanatum]KAJ7514651.1 hypothetical protein O6H91_23G053700 [Diphasiastrum complanatum]